MRSPDPGVFVSKTFIYDMYYMVYYMIPVRPSGPTTHHQVHTPEIIEQIKNNNKGNNTSTWYADNTARTRYAVAWQTARCVVYS